MINLGDTHNFGQSVALAGDMVVKPRCIFWEWMFLSKESPLRRIVSDLAISDNITDPFEAFGHLSFWPKSNLWSHEGGNVEKVDVSPLTNYSKNVSYKLGLSLGVANWFGLSDLHFENIIVGETESSEFRFVPIDIEIVFEDIGIISESNLVGITSDLKNFIGCSKLNEKKLETSTIIDGYIDAIEFFKTNSSLIDSTILAIDGVELAPIRKVIRDTADYENPNSNFIQEEETQIGRGDIPYFFYSLSDKRLKYHQLDGIEMVVSDLSSFEFVGSVFCPKRKCFRENIGVDDLKTSVLQLARTFDKLGEYSSKTDRTNVFYKNESIWVTIQDFWRLKCERLPLQYFAYSSH